VSYHRVRQLVLCLNESNELLEVSSEVDQVADCLGWLDSLTKAGASDRAKLSLKSVNLFDLLDYVCLFFADNYLSSKFFLEHLELLELRRGGFERQKFRVNLFF